MLFKRTKLTQKCAKITPKIDIDVEQGTSNYRPFYDNSSAIDIEIGISHNRLPTPALMEKHTVIENYMSFMDVITYLMNNSNTNSNTE